MYAKIKEIDNRKRNFLEMKSISLHPSEYFSKQTQLNTAVKGKCFLKQLSCRVNTFLYKHVSYFAFCFYDKHQD